MSYTCYAEAPINVKKMLKAGDDLREHALFLSSLSEEESEWRKDHPVKLEVSDRRPSVTVTAAATIGRDGFEGFGAMASSIREELVQHFPAGAWLCMATGVNHVNLHIVQPEGVRDGMGMGGAAFSNDSRIWIGVGGEDEDMGLVETPPHALACPENWVAIGDYILRIAKDPQTRLWTPEDEKRLAILRLQQSTAMDS